MKKYFIQIFTLVLFLILVHNVWAISINPAIITIEYFPNYEESFDFKTEVQEGVEVYIDGSLSEYFTVEKNNIGVDGTFTIKVKLPDEIDNPGRNTVYIGLLEPHKGGGMVSTRTSIRTPIIINVPYEGLYADITFYVSDLNVDETKQFSVTINNLGKKDIDKAKADITIFDADDNVVENLVTDEENVPSRSRKDLGVMFNASNHLPGVYSARADVTYDVLSKTIDKNFKIGSLNVEVFNYSKIFKEDTISNFFIIAESGWNDKIEGLYAEISILNGSKVLSELKTPNYDIEPWERLEISTFWDNKGLGVGTYPIKMTLYYQGARTEEEGEIQIISATDDGKFSFDGIFNFTTLLVVFIVILVLVNVFILLRRKKKEKNKK